MTMVIKCNVCDKIVVSCTSIITKAVNLLGKDHTFNVTGSLTGIDQHICTDCFNKALIKLGKVLKGEQP